MIEGTRKVRAWGDTAVVTALLWLKGTGPDGAPFDYKLWFSDTYARIGGRWRYVSGRPRCRCRRNDGRLSRGRNRHRR